MKFAQVALLGAALEGCAKKEVPVDPFVFAQMRLDEKATELPSRIEEISGDVQRAIQAAQEEAQLGRLEKIGPVTDKRGLIAPYPAHVTPREDWYNCEGNRGHITYTGVSLNPGTCVTYVPMTLSRPEHLLGISEVPGYEHVWYRFPEQFDIYETKNDATNDLTITMVKGKTEESPLCLDGMVTYRYLGIRREEDEKKRSRIQTVSMEWAQHDCPDRAFSTFVMNNEESVVDSKGWVVEYEDLIYPNAENQCNTLIYEDTYSWNSTEKGMAGVWRVNTENFAIKDQLIENFEKAWMEMAELQQATQ